MSESSEELKRIANAIEEILRLVKLDQEASKKRWEYKPEEENRPQFKV
jgi:predicted ribonuclease toxin of YeeF-YezG toxin-antitoxin module